VIPDGCAPRWRPVAALSASQGLGPAADVSLSGHQRPAGGLTGVPAAPASQDPEIDGEAVTEVPACRILVTGSRTWTDARLIRRELAWVEATMGPIVVVHGACSRGADAIASAWCRRYGVREERHPADWRMGRGAGPARNQAMVDLGADVCMAFIRDGSPGASHCAERAEAAGIPVRRWMA
jgi:hypothetical protein